MSMFYGCQRSAFLAACLLGVLASSPAALCDGCDAATAVAPAWRLYDDPTIRGDRRWFADFEEYARLIREYDGKKTSRNPQYVTLRGAYSIPAPNESGRVVRLRLNQSNLRSTRLTFRSGAEHYQIAQDRRNHRSLVAGRVMVPVDPRDSKDGKSLPVHRVTDDGGLWCALGDGLMDLRYQEGRFIVARGPRVLMSFPVEPAPTEMVLAGDARLDLFQVVELPPLELEEDTLHTPPADLRPAALMPWRLDREYYGRETEDAARLIRHDDGSVELHSTNTPVYRTAGAAFGSESPMIVTLKIHSASAGAGISLPTPNRSWLKFYIGKLDGKNVICGEPYEFRELKSSNSDLYLFSSPFFCRAAYGLDFLQIDFSDDGRTWTMYSRQSSLRHRDTSPLRIEMALGGTRRRKTNVPGPEQWIRLSAVDVRTFRLLGGFAGAGTLGGLTQDASSHGWRVACNLALINGWGPAGLRQKAVTDLLDTAVDTGVAPGRVLQSIRALVPFLLPQQMHGNTFSTQLALHLDRLASRMLTDRELDAASDWLELWYELNTGEAKRSRGDRETTTPPLIRDYLYGLRHKKEWEELRLRALEYMFFSRPDSKNLFAAWMLDQAFQHLGDASLEEGLARKQYWLHPLRIMTDRQTANLLNELAVATANDEVERACRILIQDYDKDALSVSQDDDDLYKPAQELLRRTVRSELELRNTLVEQFGRIGLVRVNRAMEQGTFDRLEQIVVQFHGTEAARKALAILADRSLSIGHFVKAAGQYDELIPSLSGVDRTCAVAKRNLALAMSGRRPTEAVAETVSLPGGSFAPDRYRELIESVLVDEAEETGNAPRTPWGPWPANGTPDLRHLMNLPFFASSPIAARQEDKYLLLQQGGALCVIDMDRQKTVWSFGSVEEKTESFSFRPLVLEDRVVAAFPGEKGESILKCFQLSDGSVLWEHKLDDPLAAEPFERGRALFLLTHSRDEHLVLQRIDPACGKPEFSQFLLRHRHQERRRDVVRGIAVDDRVIVSAAGMLICCDDWGRIRWVRRIAFVPPEADPALSEFAHGDDLLEQDGRIVVCSPGAPDLVCVDAETGSLVWTRFQPQRRRLLGLSGDAVLVRNVCSIEAVAAVDGATKWSSPAEPEAICLYPGTSGKLLGIRLDVAGTGDKPDPSAVRRAALFSAADGTEAGSWDLPHDVLPRSDLAAAFAHGRKVLLLTADCEKKRAHKEPSAQLSVLE